MRKLKVLICSNRFDKGYAYVKDITAFEWSVVRDPITDKCSKDTIERFLNQPVYAFLFAWFKFKNEAKKFARAEFAKNKEDPKHFRKEMKKEIKRIGSLAKAKLKNPKLKSQDAADGSKLGAAAVEREEAPVVRINLA